MQYQYKKIIFTILSIISIIGYGYFVYAAAPNGGYNPGQTLDPDCAPGDTDCIVALSGGGSITADNGLTATGGNVSLGGALTGDTTVDQSGFDFSIMNGDVGYQSSSDILGLGQPGVGMTYNDGSVSSMVGLLGNMVPIMSLQADFGSNHISRVITLGEPSGMEIVISNNARKTNFSIGSGAAFLSAIDTNASQNSNIEISYNNGVEFSFDGNSSSYIFPRNDGSANQVLTTNGNGQLSWETPSGGGGSGWSLTGNAGTTAGTNFIGTTDAQDFVVKTNGNQIAKFGQNGSINIGSELDLTSTFGLTLPLSTVAQPGSISVGSGNVNQTELGQIYGYNNTIDANAVLSTIIGSFNTTLGNDGTMIIGSNNTDISEFVFGESNSNTNGYVVGSSNTAIEGYVFGENNTNVHGGMILGWNNESPSYFETTMGTYSKIYTPINASSFDQLDRLLSIGNGDGSGGANDRHNAYTLWKDGSFAYNDDNFQNDNLGTEQNMFYFNYGNHDGNGNPNSKRAIRLGSTLNDEWDINSANVGENSIAIGFADLDDIDGPFPAPTASGRNSISLGAGSLSQGENSFSVFGNGQGRYSAAIMGSAQGEYSFAAATANAQGTRSVAFGKEVIAIANNSFATGYQTEALGDRSAVFGHGTKSFSWAEFVLGSFNTSYVPQGGNLDFDDRLFVVGNGTNGSESDALTILKNGQTGIGIDNFEANTNGSMFQVGDGSTNVIGYVDSGTGNWVAVSDERKKENITDLSYGLNELIQLRPTAFDYKRNHEHTIGFIAQQVLPIIPEAVYGTEDEGYGMSYVTLTPVIVKAIQEMNLKITDIGNTETPNTWRDALIAWFGNIENGITDLYAKIIHTDRVETKELCVGSVCVTEDQFLQVMNQSGQSEIIIQIDQPVVDDSTPVINDNPENTDDGSVETTETDQPANMDPVPENNISTEEIPVQ